MARQKQSTPVKGPTSSEVVNGANNTDMRNRRSPTSSSSTRKPNRTVQRKPTAQKSAGLVELLVCIGGIYASLSVPVPPFSPLYSPNKNLVFPGPSFKNESPPSATPVKNLLTPSF